MGTEPPTEGDDSRDSTVEQSDEFDSEEFADLTAFQRDILIVLAEGDQKIGLEIKDDLEAYYDESINHGRLYPNLDTLVEQGLASKEPVDDRSNQYLLTDHGKGLLRDRFNWERIMDPSVGGPSNSNVVHGEPAADADVSEGSGPEPSSKSDDASSSAPSPNEEASGEPVSSDRSDRKSIHDTPNGPSSLRDLPEGRVDNLPVRVIEERERHRDSRDCELLVETIDGQDLSLTIWSKHAIDVTWEEGVWYSLSQALHKVWERNDETEHALSSTRDIHVNQREPAVGGEADPDESGRSVPATSTTDRKAGDQDSAVDQLLDEMDFEEEI